MQIHWRPSSADLVHIYDWKIGSRKELLLHILMLWNVPLMLDDDDVREAHSL